MKKLCTLMLAAMLTVVPLVSGLAETTLPITPEKVKFTALLCTQNDAMPDPNTMAYLQELEEKTNVDIEWTVVSNTTKTERLATVFASGELPDLFVNIITDADKLTYGEAGALLPVDEYLQHMPNFTAILEKNASVKSAITMPDGHIYSVPQVNFYSYWPGNGVYIVNESFINQSWLDKLGLAAPTTTDELFDVLMAFKTQDPNGNGEADEIPLSFTYTNYTQSAAALLYGPFGIIGQGDNINVEDGKAFYAIQDERYVEAVKFMRKLYENGLIDPEAFTQDNGRYFAKGQDANELYGVFLCWDGATSVGDSRVNGDAASYVPLLPVKGPNGDQLWSNKSAGVNANYAAISTQCKQPEVLCKFLDYLFKADQSVQVLWGQNGVTTEKVADGQWYQYALKDYSASGFGSSTLYIMQTTPRVLPAYIDDEMANNILTKNLDTGEIIGKTDVAKYKLSSLYAPYAIKEYYPTTIMTAQENEIYSAISTPVINAIKEKEISWIMGQSKIEDEWESFNKELDALGLTTMVEISQAALDRAK